MSLYDRHALTLVKDVVPKDDLKALVNTFMIDAGINMGNDFSDNTLERVIDIVDNNFRFLPVHYVASAFRKGSLGHYGAGRLVPRNVYSWLNEITMEYNREVDHKRNEGTAYSGHFKDLMNCPFGKAIMKKIDWELTEDEWDKVPLKTLAEMIGRNERVTMADFKITR